MVEQVQRLNFRDRKDGKHWEGWFAGLDKTPGVKRIVTPIAAPAYSHPMLDRIAFGQAKELTHLTDASESARQPLRQMHRLALRKR